MHEMSLLLSPGCGWCCGCPIFLPGLELARFQKMKDGICKLDRKLGSRYDSQICLTRADLATRNDVGFGVSPSNLHKLLRRS